MTEQDFWAIIDEARRSSNNDVEAYGEALTAKLSKRTPDELVHFEREFEKRIDDAYRWSLWSAAYIINGGCSDDGFYYFRGWLVMQGESVYTRSLDDPDSLVDSLQDDVDAECEEVIYVARSLYEQKTGTEMPAVGTGGAPTVEPAGEPWEEDDLPGRFPRLAGIRWE